MAQAVQNFIHARAQQLATLVARDNRSAISAYTTYLEVGTVGAATAVAVVAAAKVVFASLGHTLLAAGALYIGFEAAHLVARNEAIPGSSLAGTIRDLCQKIIPQPQRAVPASDQYEGKSQ